MSVFICVTIGENTLADLEEKTKHRRQMAAHDGHFPVQKIAEFGGDVSKHAHYVIKHLLHIPFLRLSERSSVHASMIDMKIAV
jgi:hypothetical protein